MATLTPLTPTPQLSYRLKVITISDSIRAPKELPKFHVQVSISGEHSWQRPPERYTGPDGLLQEEARDHEGSTGTSVWESSLGSTSAIVRCDRRSCVVGWDSRFLAIGTGADERGVRRCLQIALQDGE